MNTTRVNQPHPTWCEPSRCTAATAAGVHRSARFPLGTADGPASASLWALPATDDLPEPTVYTTLHTGRDVVDLALFRHADRRTERRVVRQHLRDRLADLTSAHDRSAA